jgi:hypothetical protein
VLAPTEGLGGAALVGGVLHVNFVVMCFFEPQSWGKAPRQQAILKQDKESKETYSNPNKQLGKKKTKAKNRKRAN